MSTTDLDDLLATVETVRQELHPGLDGDFLREVVRAEEANPDDDPAAVQAIERALKARLAQQGRR